MTPYAGVRFDAAAPRPHVESYFLKANDKETRRALWVRATIFASVHDPAAAVAEAWAVAFDPEHGHVAVRTQVPLAAARFDKERIDVEVAGTSMTESAAKGSVTTGGREIAWDLQIERRGPPLVHFPYPAMYEGPLPSSKVTSPILDARVSGRVTAMGRTWDLEAWPGTLGHNWGRTNAPVYAWAHCNAWEEEADLVFEGLTARAQVGPFLSPKSTLLHVRHRGVRYDFTSLACIAKNKGTIGARAWSFSGASPHARVEGEVFADTDDFVGLFYPNPRGPWTYCLNTKIAHARLELRVAERAPLRFTSSRAALELGTLDPHHGVRMYV